MNNAWIYDKANSIVKKFKTRNPEKIIKELNIKIKYLPDTHSLLGMYKVILKNRFIFLADNVGSLKNTVLAHELGHDQLHRSVASNGATFQENRIFNPTNKYELEANIFAAHLLIDDEDIISLMKYANDDRELAYELGVDINLVNLKISELAKMKKLNLKEEYIYRPSSDFLKEYKPLNDDWCDSI